MRFIITFRHISSCLPTGIVQNHELAVLYVLVNDGIVDIIKKKTLW